MLNISKIQEDENNEMKGLTGEVLIFLFFFVMLIISNIQTSLLSAYYRNRICILDYIF